VHASRLSAANHLGRSLPKSSFARAFTALVKSLSLRQFQSVCRTTLHSFALSSSVNNGCVASISIAASCFSEKVLSAVYVHHRSASKAHTVGGPFVGCRSTGRGSRRGCGCLARTLAGTPAPVRLLHNCVLLAGTGPCLEGNRSQSWCGKEVRNRRTHAARRSKAEFA